MKTLVIARNLCVFSGVQIGTPGLTHKGCVLQRVSLGALSDVTVILGMRQSILQNASFCHKPHYNRLQRFEEFIYAKNNIKQRNLNTVLAKISQKQCLQHPTHSS